MPLGAGRARSSALTDRHAARSGSGRGARAAPCAITAGRRTAARWRRDRDGSGLDAQARIGQSGPMNILLATDAFPPVCGGSGWSTYELARGLRAARTRRHDRPAAPGTRAGVRETDYDGLRVLEFGAPAPRIPYVRNYFKNERLYATLARRSWPNSSRANGSTSSTASTC